MQEGQAAEVVKSYIAAWNEPDEAARRGLLEGAWSDGGTYVDPNSAVEGREALVAHISRFQQNRPGARIELTSGTESHHGLLRFTWRMVDSAGAVLAEGLDFGEIGGDGRLRRIVVFFGTLPK